MKVTVINGSPRGEESVTLQTVLFVQGHFPDDQFTFITVGRHIRKMEGDAHELSSCIRSMAGSDLVLFSYPVYTLMAPYQLHRFIELLKDSGVRFPGVMSTQITTSKHFFDVTAHAFLEENCRDLGLTPIRGLSADMEDLLSDRGRAQALDFWKYVRFMSAAAPAALRPAEASRPRRVYRAGAARVEKRQGFDTVLLTNCGAGDENLANMINDFEALYPFPLRVVRVDEIPFKGGCLGCFSCASDGGCVYTDGFDTFLRTKIQSADAILYAFTIRDHSMGSSFKLYDDRQFCNGHRSVTMGKPAGYIVSGRYGTESNLRLIIEGRCEVGGNFLARVATDESGDDEQTRRELETLARVTCYALENRLALPANFLGQGGRKILRDLIYLMRGLMKEDHRFFRKHGIYDFPQKRVGTMLKMMVLGSLMAIPSVRSRMRGRLTGAILAPYRKVVDRRGRVPR
jgi:multimeric flavodoxin WrbA